jgi:hypothetical protein
MLDVIFHLMLEMIFALTGLISFSFVFVDVFLEFWRRQPMLHFFLFIIIVWHCLAKVAK